MHTSQTQTSAYSSAHQFCSHREKHTQKEWASQPSRLAFLAGAGQPGKEADGRHSEGHRHCLDGEHDGGQRQNDGGGKVAHHEVVVDPSPAGCELGGGAVARVLGYSKGGWTCVY